MGVLVGGSFQNSYRATKSLCLIMMLILTVQAFRNWVLYKKDITLFNRCVEQRMRALDYKFNQDNEIKFYSVTTP
ncbi:MAG: hypothetical protein WDO15_08680 [Bacteroidota bacterium]